MKYSNWKCDLTYSFLVSLHLWQQCRFAFLIYRLFSRFLSRKSNVSDYREFAPIQRRHRGIAGEYFTKRRKRIGPLAILGIFVVHAWNICRPVFSCKRIIGKGYAIFPPRQTQLPRAQPAFIFLSTTFVRALLRDEGEHATASNFSIEVSLFPSSLFTPSSLGSRKFRRHGIRSGFTVTVLSSKTVIVYATENGKRMACSERFSAMRNPRYANYYLSGKLWEIRFDFQRRGIHLTSDLRWMIERKLTRSWIMHLCHLAYKYSIRNI